jgi:ubiquinone/menaquinone biosynthesis C-methylase UbiE
MVRFDAELVFGEDYLPFYEPVLTDERNRAEADEIIATLGLDTGSRVLDAPCGHGRIANLLAGRGLVVTGLDASAQFLDRARADAERHRVEVSYVEGDLRALPADAEFDAVVCWFTSFGYFDDDDNRRVLTEFRRVLVPGGRLLIETMHHDGFVRSVMSAPAPATSAVRVGDNLMVDESTFDPVTGRAETERTVVRDGRVRRARFSVRLPTPPEFVTWLHAAGFEDVRFADRHGEQLTLESRRLVVVAS